MMYPRSKRAQQNGTVLVMALLLLFVMTLIGVSTMTTSTGEERMAGNARDRQLAFQAAESAMRDAENYISTSVAAITTFNNTNGLYAIGKGPTTSDAFDKATWWTTTGDFKLYSNTSNSLKDVKSPPLYTIEYRGLVPMDDKSKGITIGSGYDPKYKKVQIESFRVTSRGTGVTDNAVVILQSHWGKRFN